MQVFVPYVNPFLTAKCLDKKRLNKQIIECQQILNAINDKSKGWRNHPITKMYRNHTAYLTLYKQTLEHFRNGRLTDALDTARQAMKFVPPFITDEYINVMRRRLFTKDNNHYKQFSSLGECDYNVYFIDNQYVKYYQRTDGRNR